MPCIDVFLEDSVVIDGEVKGLGFRLFGKESMSNDESRGCMGGDDSISPDTVTSVVGVIGIGNLKSNARDDSIVESEQG